MKNKKRAINTRLSSRNYSNRPIIIKSILEIIKKYLSRKLIRKII